MLGEIGGNVVEVVGQLDLTLKHPERLRDGTAALHWHQPGDGPAGALNHDLFAALGQLDQPRQLALGLMHSHADHEAHATTG